jgi:hypothetical protein
MTEENTVYTPPAIKGYRKLTQAELDAVNEVKALGEHIDAVLHNTASRDVAYDPRALAIARTEFQTALMWMTRSITKPETFA